MPTALIIGDSMVDNSPLAKRLGDLLTADGYQVTQAGLGATSTGSWDDQDVVKRAHKTVDTGALPKGVDLLIVSLGTNDAANANRAGGDLAKKAAGAAGRIVKIAGIYQAKRTVWVLPPWLRGNVAWYTQPAAEFIYAAAPAVQGQQGVELFDSRPVTKADVLAGSGDGVHPGAKLQRKWADAVHAAIRAGGKRTSLWLVAGVAVAAAIWYARR